MPRIKAAIPRARAVEIVEFLRRTEPHVEVYPRAWGNDWGVSITDPARSDDDLHETYHSYYQLHLLTPPGVE